eukprot:gene4677-biopygen617
MMWIVPRRVCPQGLCSAERPGISQPDGGSAIPTVSCPLTPKADRDPPRQTQRRGGATTEEGGRAALPAALRAVRRRRRRLYVPRRLLLEHRDHVVPRDAEPYQQAGPRRALQRRVRETGRWPGSGLSVF